MVKTTIGRFNCELISNTDETTYFVFDRRDYESLNNILETESTSQSFSRSLSKINIRGLKTPKYDKNKKIFELHSGEEYCKLYHIEDCTVQVFTNWSTQNLAGILIVNLDKSKREDTIKTLERILE